MAMLNNQMVCLQEDNNGDMEDDEVYIDTSLEKINKASFSLRIGRGVHCRFHKWWHPIIYFNRIFHYKLSIFGDAQFMETSILYTAMFHYWQLPGTHGWHMTHRWWPLVASHCQGLHVDFGREWNLWFGQLRVPTDAGDTGWWPWAMGSGWWFGTWTLFFHMLGIIIPTDFHIFQRGRLNHQPGGSCGELNVRYKKKRMPLVNIHTLRTGKWHIENHRNSWFSHDSFVSLPEGSPNWYLTWNNQAGAKIWLADTISVQHVGLQFPRLFPQKTNECTQVFRCHPEVCPLWIAVEGCVFPYDSIND